MLGVEKGWRGESAIPKRDECSGKIKLTARRLFYGRSEGRPKGSEVEVESAANRLHQSTSA